MNIVAEVAKSLGVELGEEFYIAENFDTDKSYRRYKITKEGGLAEYRADLDKFILNYALFSQLICGYVNILKHEWIPQNGENYYYVTNDGYIEQSKYDCDKLSHQYRLQMGNYFKTKEEATENIEAYLKYYKNPITSWRV